MPPKLSTKTESIPTGVGVSHSAGMACDKPNREVHSQFSVKVLHNRAFELSARQARDSEHEMRNDNRIGLHTIDASSCIQVSAIIKLFCRIRRVNVT